jgi:hypothetical protein
LEQQYKRKFRIQEFKDWYVDEYNNWEECKAKLDKIYSDEELYWQQRSKLQWLLEDLNTKSFHFVANNRKNK